MRARALPAAVSLMIVALGCSSILQIEPGKLDDDGAASSSSSSGGGAGVSECQIASDCPPAPFPECREVTCVAHRCGSVDAASGTLTISQIAGDCQQIECDGHGLVRSAVADDPRDDGRECTVDTCAQGVPMNTAKPAGAPCTQGGGAVCSGAGDCIGCLGDADCPGKICKASICVPAGCSDLLKDAGETDVDCGGPCSPCADGLGCVGAADCQSGVCKNKLCKAPKCNDHVKNGAETDTDCGGGCPPCSDGKTCGGGGDCSSMVCAADVCCTPKMDAITCLGHCGPVANDCGQTVPCGGCPPATSCLQGICVCFPDPPATTCAGKCGSMLNNCNQIVDCGPCGP